MNFVSYRSSTSGTLTAPFSDEAPAKASMRPDAASQICAVPLPARITSRDCFSVLSLKKK